MGYNRWLNRDLQNLAASDTLRARVLFADGGSGKSFELRRTVERLNAAGDHVVLIDLGEHVTGIEVRDEIRDAGNGWDPEAHSGDLVLAFDSFDESLVDVRNLAEILKKELGKLDPSRLRVVIASRPAQWDATLSGSFRGWWGDEQVAELHLAPLSEANVAAAAASEGIDVDALLESVRHAGAEPLAARPITLRLLLGSSQDGTLPTRQLDVYRVGVDALLVESAERRRERRREGLPVAVRRNAARRLAAACLLSGRTTVIRRALPGQKPNELALDDVASDLAELDALEDVLVSAAFEGLSEARRWCHHSVAEYLCAEQLGALPVDTVWNLLSAPMDVARLRPALEQVAAWTAAVNAALFDRLLAQQPQLLLTDDLRGRSDTDRERVGRAVIARLQAGEPLTERRPLDGLVYPDLGDDLRAIIDPAQPTWRRRDGLFLIAGSGIRTLDEELMNLVDATTGRSTYDETAQLAVYAAHILGAATSQEVTARMRTTVADPSVLIEVRSALASSLFPRHAPATELALVFTADERLHGPNARPLTQMLRRAVLDGQAEPAAVLPWFDGMTEVPPGRAVDDRVRDLAGWTAMAVLADFEVGAQEWVAAAELVSWLLDDPRGAGPDATAVVEGLSSERRIAACRAVLNGSTRVEELVDRLRQTPLLTSVDLLAWLGVLEMELTAHEGTNPPSGHVVATLAWECVDDESLLDAARARCSATPALSAVLEDALSPELVQRRRDMRRQAAERQERRRLEQASHLFDASRLDAAVATGDLGGVLAELQRKPALDSGHSLPPGPMAAWSALTDASRRDVVEIAAAHLRAAEPDVSDFNDLHELAEALILVAATPDADGGPQPWLDQVPSEHWVIWLPALMGTALGAAAPICLREALRHDPDGVENVMVKALEGSAQELTHLTEWLLAAIPKSMLDRLAPIALARSQDPDLPASALAPLLTFAEAARPHETCQVALVYVRNCPPAPPPGPRDVDQPEIHAWLKTVAAVRVLIASAGIEAVFTDVIEEFNAHPDLLPDAVRSLDAWQTRRSWGGLTSPQLAELYLWAKSTMPSPGPARPGALGATDRAVELPDDVLGLLRGRTDMAAAAAYGRVAEQTGDVFLRAEASRMAAEVASSATQPPSPEAVLEVLDDPSVRVVQSVQQLAEVVLEELNALQDDLLRDRGLRRRYWYRQRAGTRWSGTWVPLAETELSTELRLELAQRLGARVAVFREVEIQAGLAGAWSDNPDLLAVRLSTDDAGLLLPMEVKGNFHADVVGALQGQLADRYLDGRHGSVGIYIVGFWSGDKWDPTDSRRRQRAERFSSEKLRELLDAEAQAAASNGKIVSVRVVDIPLELDDLTGADELADDEEPGDGAETS